MTGLRLIVCVLLCAAMPAFAQDVPPDHPALDARDPDAVDPLGVATGDIVYGALDAPVTLIEYASWTCPHCGAFHRQIAPGLKQRFVDAGQLRIILREYPLQGFDLAVSSLVRCQGPAAMEGLADSMFNRQKDWLNEDALQEVEAIAQEAGIDNERFETCLRDRALHQAIVERAQADQALFGIAYTPYLVLNGEVVEVPGGEAGLAKLSDLIDAALP